MAGTKNDLNFNIQEIPEGMDANAMVANMRSGVDLTQEEMNFAERQCITIMGSLHTKIFPNPSEHDKISFDRMFIGNESVEDLCRNRTESMGEDERDFFMRCFVTTEAMARDKIISYVPPASEYGNQPPIRLTTAMSSADIEKERPKPGFFRRIGEALRILKPLPFPQREYENMLETDSNSPASIGRAAEIKARIKHNHAAAVEKVGLSIQEMEAENMTKADAEKLERQLASEARKTHGPARTPEERLKDLQDARKLFIEAVHTKSGNKVGSNDYFIHVSPIEEGSMEAKDNPEAIMELQRRTKDFYFPRYAERTHASSQALEGQIEERRMESEWQLKDPRNLEPNEVFVINLYGLSSPGASSVVRGFDRDIKALEDIINPPKIEQGENLMKK